jgi:hypothetical protein
MKAQWVRLGGAALILSAVIACGGDGVTAAGSAPRLKRMKIRDVIDTVTVASRATPLAADQFASKVIGPEGGSLELPGAGLKLVVPANAVSSSVTFTVMALPGAMVAYEFGPHGTTFKVPLRVEQDLRGVVIPQGQSLLAGYFPDQSDLLVDDIVGTIDERLPAQLDATGSKVRFDVSHFSGYLVASGRTRAYAY